MNLVRKVLLSAAIGGVGAGVAIAQQQPTTGPVAVYWMSAATSTGMGGMAGMGMGGPGGPGMGGQPSRPPAQSQAPRRPGLGAMMGMALGGGVPGFGGGGREAAQGAQGARGYGGYGGAGGMPGMAGSGAATHALTLQLGSSQAAQGPPDAAHLPPDGLGAGPSLPLVTPQVARPEPAEDSAPPQMTQRPKGRMLIYWGCGDHAAAAPIVIDFSRIGPNMPAPNIPFIAASPGRPPSPGRFATYGEWPNERGRTTVPPDGSLVGAHVVRGNYSPEIHFSLGPDQDFLPPLNVTSMDPTPAGGTRVSWSPVTGATGYYAWLFGAQDRGETVVVWTSGSVANMMGALTDYLPPSEVRRLIAQQVVMPPQTTQCIVPSEVVKASPFGMLSMIAYGDETDYADPPRPKAPKVVWNIRWTVKVRRKSTTSALLGMPAGAGRY